MAEGLYFSHDYSSRNDARIKKLIQKHGMAGYGIFWSIVENLYNNTNVLRLDYECIAFELRCEESVIQSVINDFDLFKIDGEFFYSESIKRRLDLRKQKSEKARESISYRWKNTNVLRNEYERNTIKEKKRKEKESKVNKNIKEIDKEKKFEKPEISEIILLFLKSGSNEIEAQKFEAFYDSINWMVGKNKMKNWKSAAKGWILRNSEKQTGVVKFNSPDLSKAERTIKAAEESLNIKL